MQRANISRRVKMGATASTTDHHHGRTAPFENNNDGQLSPWARAKVPYKSAMQVPCKVPCKALLKATCMALVHGKISKPSVRSLTFTVLE